MAIHEAIAGLRLLASEVEGRAPIEGASLREAMLSVPGLLWSRVSMPSGMIQTSEGGSLRALGLSPGEVVGQSIYDWPRNPVTVAIERAYETAQPVTRFVSPGFGGVYLGTYVPTKDQDGQWSVQGHVVEIDQLLTDVLADPSHIDLLDDDRRGLLRTLLADVLAVM